MKATLSALARAERGKPPWQLKSLASPRDSERHYAHLSPSYIAETIRATFLKLGIVETGTVTALRPGTR